MRQPHPAEIATVAMSTMAAVLHDAGLLRHAPEPPPVAMTVEEAAELVCRRAQTPRLDPNDPADVASVASSREQYEYAWAAVGRAGYRTDDVDLLTAARVLAKHHGLV